MLLNAFVDKVLNLSISLSSDVGKCLTGLTLGIN